MAPQEEALLRLALLAQRAMFTVNIRVCCSEFSFVSVGNVYCMYFVNTRVIKRGLDIYGPL